MYRTILQRLNLAPRTRVVYCGRGFPVSGPCKRLEEVEDDLRDFYEKNGECPGHEEPFGKVVFPFDGWDLAYYLQRWKEQVPDGKAPWFSERQEHWSPKQMPEVDIDDG